MILLSMAGDASQSQNAGEDKGSAATADGQVDGIGPATAEAPASAASFPKALFDYSKLEAYRQQLSKWVLLFPGMLSAQSSPLLNQLGE